MQCIFIVSNVQGLQIIVVLKKKKIDTKTNLYLNCFDWDSKTFVTNKLLK